MLAVQVLIIAVTEPAHSLKTKSALASGRVRRVAVGVRLAPIPGAADDAFQVRILRLPAELTLDFFGAGDQHRGIARPARRFFGGNGMAGNAANGFDHFA